MGDAANVLGNFFKLLVAAIIFGFSTVLEYAFFLSITPADKPWFPILAMGLTAGGFLGWMLSFRLIRHNPLHTIIAFLMMIGCAMASLVVAGTEFYSWIAEHYNIVTNPAMYQNVTEMLLVIFCGHVVALLVDVSCGHFAKNPFRGNVIPQNPYPQNVIPMQPGYYYPQVYGQQQNLIPQNGGETAAPLALGQGQPKEERNLEKTGEIEQPRQLKPLPPVGNREPGILSEAASLAMSVGKNYIKRGRTAVLAHGNRNQTTSENS